MRRCLAILLLTLSAPACANTTVERATECLALAMYWEARGEGDIGMYAVGAVVMNRARDRRFPGTVCDVVFQGGETPPCQFSWWCDGKSDRPTDQKAWRRARYLARHVLYGRVRDPTRGALYFHSVDVNPRWRLRVVARIGNHWFYR